MNLRPTKSAHGRRRLAGLATGAALLASLAVTGPAGTLQASADADCLSKAPANARVAFGHAGAVDPNSVSTKQAAAMQRSLEARIAQLKASGKLKSERGLGTITIKTHAHILRKSNGKGGASKKMVRRQIQVLNDAYAGTTNNSAVATPFKFALKSIDVTKKTAWYDWGYTNSGEDGQAKAAKRKLHKGGYADLNLYFAKLSGGLLGYATFPGEGGKLLDGVVILDQSLPGGNAKPYNKGDTGTHEVGHWLGLFHTFQNGCLSPGDEVDDTPYQSDGDNIYYCGDNPAFGNDTCLQDGIDPVHNFMSYGDDQCLNRFTAGQSMRMGDAWQAYRAGQ